MRTKEQIDALVAVIEAHRTAPWVRGERDCGTFAADCLLAIGAPDSMGDLRNNYTDRMRLTRLISALGFRDVESYVADWCERNDYPDCPPACCQIGDLGITNTGVFCIRTSEGFVAMAEAGGLYLVNPKRAWAVKWA